MDDDGFFVEFFATEFGPDEREKKSHEEYNDGLRRIGGDGGHGHGGGGCKGGAVSEFYGSADKEIGQHGAKDFFMTSFDNLIPSAMPFAITPNDD